MVAHQCPVDLAGPDGTVRVDQQLDHQGEPILTRDQGRAPEGELLREHGVAHNAGEDGRGVGSGMAVERRRLGDPGVDVGNGHAEASGTIWLHIGSRDLIEVARRALVDRDPGERTQVTGVGVDQRCRVPDRPGQRAVPWHPAAALRAGNRQRSFSSVQPRGGAAAPERYEKSGVAYGGAASPRPRLGAGDRAYGLERFGTPAVPGLEMVNPAASSSRRCTLEELTMLSGTSHRRFRVTLLQIPVSWLCAERAQIMMEMNEYDLTSQFHGVRMGAPGRCAAGRRRGGRAGVLRRRRAEFLAIIESWRAAGRLFPHNELLQAIVVELDPARREAQERAANAGRSTAPPTPGAILNEALDLCARAVQLLAHKATPEETADYQRFVLEIAAAVADAASESSVFGFGLGRDCTSGAERYVLQQVERALEVQA